MDDDFNTPQAKAVIFQMVTQFYIDNIKLENIECLEYVKNTIVELGEVLGLSLDIVDKMDSETRAMIEERNKARSTKDFKKADSIRKKLEARGIILEDTKDGTTWRRKI
jgi:cysteinyl-tRNA synthetase